LGHTSGLKPSHLKLLQRIFRRRYPSQGGYSSEQAHELAGLSEMTGRQLGLLIDRQGRPSMLLVGDRDQIVIPDLGRQRQSEGRLRGLRLLHTHFGTAGLSQDDLMDLVFLRLDSIAALTVNDHGQPDQLQWAQILPPNPQQKLYQVSPVQPWDRVTTDFTAQAEALESELHKHFAPGRNSTSLERALLISVSTAPKGIQETSLQELADLVHTAGLETVGRLVQRVNAVNPKHILGRGKLAELEVQALQSGAGVLVFDRELAPAQMRNLAELTERKILDRTQVILDIFAQHATSRAGKLQVELAQLDYTLPRLVGRNKALSRLAGGIGGRGPGETKLELDRRRIKDRRTKINKELAKVRDRRGATRNRRDKAGLPIVALVGYTNAGKSTLLNTLTSSRVLTADKLFATLDPVTRRLRFPQDREVILTDTVGFIRSLPASLREAFLATLEELDAADVLVQVADARHPELNQHVEAVQTLLRELGLHGIPRLLVLNKWDLVDFAQRMTLTNRYPDALPVSAQGRYGLRELMQRIGSKLPATEAGSHGQPGTFGLNSEYMHLK
jgi:GTP-binding protein HflX